MMTMMLELDTKAAKETLLSSEGHGMTQLIDIYGDDNNSNFQQDFVDLDTLNDIWIWDWDWRPRTVISVDRSNKATPIAIEFETGFMLTDNDAWVEDDALVGVEEEEETEQQQPSVKVTAKDNNKENVIVDNDQVPPIKPVKTCSTTYKTGHDADTFDQDYDQELIDFCQDLVADSHGTRTANKKRKKTKSTKSPAPAKSNKKPKLASKRSSH